MSSYEELEKEFQEKVAELQRKCDHKDVSDWQKLYWAPAHSTRFEVKTCLKCRAIVAERTKCDSCGKWVEKPNWIEGDGQKIPTGTFFCSEKCIELYKVKHKLF